MMRRLAAVFATLFALALMAALVLAFFPRAPVLPLAGPVDRIVIDKAARRMQVIVAGEVARVYHVSLGFEPTDNKQREGDGRTPEGLFRVDRRNATSAYHLSLGLDYPRPEDRAQAAAAGVSPGGDIFIHGQPNVLPAGITLPHDWTAGCIALANAEIEALWPWVAVGTPVEIRP